MILSQPGEVDGGMRWRVELDPRREWASASTCSVVGRDGIPPSAPDVEALRRGAGARPGLAGRRGSSACRSCARRGTRSHHAFHRSVADLASLRIRRLVAWGSCPAAGMPWFMTVFGRDTIITSRSRRCSSGPELAITALRVLADLQARGDDPEIDAEPGKIIHEVRHGKAARAWFGGTTARRRDAALPDPALGGLALDGR